METKPLGTFVERYKNGATARHWVTVETPIAERIVRLAGLRGVTVGVLLKLAVLDWLSRQDAS